MVGCWCQGGCQRTKRAEAIARKHERGTATPTAFHHDFLQWQNESLGSSKVQSAGILASIELI